MGSNEREIVIRLRADGTAEVVDALKQTGDGVKATGKEADATAKTTEKAGLASKTAFWGIGQAAEEMGRKVGITGQASRRLGNVVEDLAARVPAIAVGFGVVTLAGGVLLTVYDYLIERKKALDQATIAAGDSMMKEVIGMDHSWQSTNRMKDATYDLYKAKRELAIFTETEAIAALQRQLEKEAEAQASIGALTSGFIYYGQGATKYYAELGKASEKANKTMAVHASEMLARQIFLDNMQGKGPARKDQVVDIGKYNQDQIDILKSHQEYLDGLARMDMAAADQDRLQFDLAKARGESMEAVWQKELQAYDSMGAAKLAAAKNNFEATKVWDEYLAGREILSLQRAREINDKKMSLAAAEAQRRSDYGGMDGATLTEQYDLELQAFDAATNAKIFAAQTLDDRMEIFSQRTLQRLQLEAQQQQKTRQMEKQLMDLRVGTISAGLNAIDTITKGKYKGIFYAMQGMAAAQAVMHGEAAAAAAIAPPPIGLGPVAGAGLAWWARAQGYASAALIMAQTFAGGGKGAGGGAVGTYSANADTGQPEYKYFDYESSRYGSGWRPGESQAQPASSQQMNVTINAMDSKSFEKYVRDNPNAIKTVLKDIQGGYV